MKEITMNERKDTRKCVVIPEYIEGIPTERKRQSERKKIVKKIIDGFIHSSNNHFYNEFLQEPIYITSESKTESVFKTATTWRSTFAVLHLPDILKYAVAEKNQQVFFPPKKQSKTQNDANLVNLAILYYNFEYFKNPILNFKVKLTVGIKSNDKYIYYCLSGINIIK